MYLNKPLQQLPGSGSVTTSSIHHLRVVDVLQLSIRELSSPGHKLGMLLLLQVIFPPHVLVQGILVRDHDLAEITAKVHSFDLPETTPL